MHHALNCLACRNDDALLTQPRLLDLCGARNLLPCHGFPLLCGALCKYLVNGIARRYRNSVSGTFQLKSVRFTGETTVKYRRFLWLWDCNLRLRLWSELWCRWRGNLSGYRRRAYLPFALVRNQLVQCGYAIHQPGLNCVPANEKFSFRSRYGLRSHSAIRRNRINENAVNGVNLFLNRSAALFRKRRVFAGDALVFSALHKNL